MINISYEDIIDHVINMRIADIKGMEGVNVTREYEIKLYDEFIGMVRLTSIVCDVPFQKVLDDAVEAVFGRLCLDEAMHGVENEEIVGLTDSD